MTRRSSRFRRFLPVLRSSNSALLALGIAVAALLAPASMPRAFSATLVRDYRRWQAVKFAAVATAFRAAAAAPA